MILKSKKRKTKEQAAPNKASPTETEAKRRDTAAEKPEWEKQTLAPQCCNPQSSVLLGEVNCDTQIPIPHSSRRKRVLEKYHQDNEEDVLKLVDHEDLLNAKEPNFPTRKTK